jgi:hypothetical protein
MRPRGLLRLDRGAAVALVGLVIVAGSGAAYAASARHAAGGRGVIVSAITSELGVSRAQLRADLASGQTLADVAAANNVSLASLESAITTAVRNRLDEAVSAGLLSSTREQAVLSRLDARVGMLVNVKHPAAHVAVALRLRRAVVRLSAQYLGITPKELRVDLRSGQTLSQLASANGKSPSDLEQAVTSAIKARLDAAVSAGRLSTQAESTILSALQTRLSQVLS